MKPSNQEGIGRDVARNFRQLNEELVASTARVAALETQAWTNLTLTNGWVVFSAGWATPRYRKIGDIVYVQGMVKDGTTSVAIATLPVGFRPTEIQMFCQQTSVGPIRLDIGSNGQIVLYTGGAGVWGSINCHFSTI